MIGYEIENTLTEHGRVARGVCRVEEGLLKEIVERTHIEPREGGAAFTEDGERFTFLPNGTVVSMNCWGFQPGMADEIEARFGDFLGRNLPVSPLCGVFPALVPIQLIGRATPPSGAHDEREMERGDVPRGYAQGPAPPTCTEAERRAYPDETVETRYAGVLTDSRGSPRPFSANGTAAGTSTRPTCGNLAPPAAISAGITGAMIARCSGVMANIRAVTQYWRGGSRRRAMC
jgi:hypothetical protein